MGPTGSHGQPSPLRLGVWVIKAEPVVFIRVLFEVGVLFISIKISFSFFFSFPLIPSPRLTGKLSPRASKKRSECFLSRSRSSLLYVETSRCDLIFFERVDGRRRRPS